MKFSFGSAVLAALLAVGVVPGNAAMAADDGLAQIKSADRIRIGVFGDKPPFGYIDSNGQSQGFDVEIAKAFARDLLGSPDKVEFVITEAANRVEYLKSGKVDIILANFTQTKERARVVDFAAPYMKVSLGVVSPEKAPIKDVAELQGKTLLVNKGTTADAYFSKKYPEQALLKFDQNTETFDALKDGRGVALAHDNAPGYVVAIGELGEPEFIAPAVKKGDTALKDWVDQEVATLKKDGRLKAAYEKTLKPVYGDKVSADRLLAE